MSSKRRYLALHEDQVTQDHGPGLSPAVQLPHVAGLQHAGGALLQEAAPEFRDGRYENSLFTRLENLVLSQKGF